MIASRIATVVRVIGLVFLGGTVLVTPWCYGSIHASVQQWLFGSIGVSLICGMIALCLDWKASYRFPILFVPVLLIIFLVGQQLRPLEHAELTKRSPKVAELRGQLLPAPDSAEYAFTKALCPGVQSNTDPAPTSIYPAATRHQLSLFVLVVSAFVAASLLFRERLSVLIFSAAVAGNGFLLVMLGMIMRLKPNSEFFHFYSNSPGLYSAFLNRNNAAGYLGMCLGLALIFLFWYVFRTDKEVDNTRRWDRDFARVYQTAWQKFLYRLARYLTPGALTWGFIAAVLISGICISMSRGGILAMSVALVLGGLVIVSTMRFRLSLIGLAMVAVLGIGLVFWAGMNERVQKRIESIFTVDNSARPTNWGNAIETARDFHWRGTGFGTYQYANLLNDEFSTTNQIFVRAENQYIEIFLDLGPWGLSLFLVCLVIVLTLCWRLIWQRKDTWLIALGGGLFIAVLTQVFASLFDFGLYITANAMLFSVLCGILSAVRCQSREETVERFSLVTLAQQVAMLLCGGLMLVMLGSGHKEIKNIYRIEVAVQALEAESTKAPQKISFEKLAEAAAQLDKALQVRPDDAIAQTALGESQIRLFRLATWNELMQSPSSLSETEKWNRTSLKSIHASLGMLLKLSLKAPVNAIRNNPTIDEFLNPAFCHFVSARQANLMSQEAHFRIAELVPLLDRNNDQQEFAEIAIGRVTQVSPLNTAAWYEAGTLKRNLGHSAEARACWQKSLSLSKRYLAPIAKMTQIDMRSDNAETLFRNTFPNSPEIFLTLATHHFNRNTSPDFYEEALEAFRVSLETNTETSEGEQYYYRGSYFLLMQQYDEAVENFLLACQRNRSKHEWRHQLAKAYYANKEYDRAKEEMESALFYAPTNKSYQLFRDEIKRKSITD